MISPLTKILDIEAAKAPGSLISTRILSGWVQRVIIFLRTANCALSIEQRLSWLIKVDPKMGEISPLQRQAPLSTGVSLGNPSSKN